ncbi:hypothetical protein Bbelb_186740 [Branchiostoma belcheri]|nr:hypothetical protein Bbelb_186740 [Branchiostoma belcheri]
MSDPVFVNPNSATAMRKVLRHVGKISNISRYNDNSPCSRKWLVRLQDYNYTIKYKPGKEMVLADALSRLCPHEKQEMEGMKVKIHHIVNIPSVKLTEVQEETKED